MMNMLTLVGRVINDPILKKDENRSTYANITLAITRRFKDADGTYPTDYIDCVVRGNVAQGVCEYLSKGDLIGIKGEIRTTKKELEIVANSVTFLASKQKNMPVEDIDEELEIV